MLKHRQAAFIRDDDFACWAFIHTQRRALSIAHALHRDSARGLSERADRVVNGLGLVPVEAARKFGQEWHRWL